MKAYTEEVFAEVAATWSLRGPPPPPSERLAMPPGEVTVARAVKRKRSAQAEATHRAPDPDYGALAKRVASELETGPIGQVACRRIVGHARGGACLVDAVLGIRMRPQLSLHSHDASGRRVSLPHVSHK